MIQIYSIYRQVFGNNLEILEVPGSSFSGTFPGYDQIKPEQEQGEFPLIEFTSISAFPLHLAGDVITFNDTCWIKFGGSLFIKKAAQT